MNTVATKPDTKTKPEVKGKADTALPEANVKNATPKEVEVLLATKSEAELEAIFKAMEVAVKEKQSTKKADAIKQIEEIAQAAGLEVAIKGHRKPKVNAKTYRNPNNASETFVMDGIAKRPDWLKELLK